MWDERLDALSEVAQRQGLFSRRPWLLFFIAVALLVSAFSGAPQALLAAARPQKRPLARNLATAAASSESARFSKLPRASPMLAEAPPRRAALSAEVQRTLAVAAAAASARAAILRSMPPLPAPAVAPPPPPLGGGRTVDAPGAADPGGAPRISESSPMIQGMIEAGFSRAQAREALEAVGARSMTDVQKAIDWQLKKDADANRLEAARERSVIIFPSLDLDGYALAWGSDHRTETVEQCGQACLRWKPLPPSFYACNAFVFCGLVKCYAPAALPPGSMVGQCWLKHQPDPVHPQVNMKGNYSDAYRRRHAGAPPSVQWQSGVVVPVESVGEVDTSTWSARANW